METNLSIFIWSRASPILLSSSPAHDERLVLLFAPVKPYQFEKCDRNRQSGSTGRKIAPKRAQEKSLIVSICADPWSGDDFPHYTGRMRAVAIDGVAAQSQKMFYLQIEVGNAFGLRRMIKSRWVAGGSYSKELGMASF